MPFAPGSYGLRGKEFVSRLSPIFVAPEAGSIHDSLKPKSEWTATKRFNAPGCVKANACVAALDWFGSG
jgi:hypothetical protein